MNAPVPVEITQQAQEDLVLLSRFLSTSTARLAFLERVTRVIEQVAQFPQMGVASERLKGLRRCVIPPHYALFYRTLVETDTIRSVQVVSIQDTRRPLLRE